MTGDRLRHGNVNESIQVQKIESIRRLIGGLAHDLNDDQVLLAPTPIPALKPALKVLFISGYTADVIAHRGILKEDMQFIKKPLDKNSLARGGEKRSLSDG